MFIDTDMGVLIRCFEQNKILSVWIKNKILKVFLKVLSCWEWGMEVFSPLAAMLELSDLI